MQLEIKSAYCLIADYVLQGLEYTEYFVLVRRTLYSGEIQSILPLKAVGQRGINARAVSFSSCRAGIP